MTDLERLEEIENSLRQHNLCLDEIIKFTARVPELEAENERLRFALYKIAYEDGADDNAAGIALAALKEVPKP